jgi:hypothetical protein
MNTDTDVWNVTFSHFRGLPDTFTGTADDVCKALQAFADTKNLGELEIEDYTDEIHAFFRRNGRRRAFAYVQFC